MDRRKLLILVALGIGLLFLLAFPWFSGDYYAHILILVFLNVVLAVGYRLLYVTGLGSFCHATFYALGGYASAILGQKVGLPYGLCLIAAGIVPAIFAVIIGWPSMRVKGPYFFLTTFAFFMVMDSVFRHWTRVTNGARGLTNIPGIAPIGTMRPYYYLAIALMAVTILVMYRLDRSRFGAELLAIGDDEDLAKSVGINVPLTRIIAFSVGAMFAGFAGSIYASYISFISPASFTLLSTIFVLIWVVIGGPRKLWGPIAGAVLMTFVAELLRMSGTLQAILYAIVLLVAILVIPQGLVGLVDDLRTRFGRGGGPGLKPGLEESAPAIPR